MEKIILEVVGIAFGDRNNCGWRVITDVYNCLTNPR